MHEDMLVVSWYDLQTMGRIPAGFPNTICGPSRHVALRASAEGKKAGNSNAEKLVETNSYEIPKNKLLPAFQDVLRDELSPTPMKTDVPMHITLKKDYFPLKTLSARRVSLRYEDEAAKTISELIEKNQGQRNNRMVQPSILCA